MKNIHLIPTNNEQHSIIQKNTGLLLIQTPRKEYSGTKLNIYITSDEEIKESDWCLNVSKNLLYKKDKVPMDIMWRKIILTTDQDLIANGVQEIDNEFLEWFVKNPSCEKVKVSELKFFNPDTNESAHCKWEYDLPQEEAYDRTYQPIILSDIDKEEPKQETLELPVEINFANEIEQISEYDKGRWYGRIEGAKWQEQRMYSEEEAGELVYTIIGQYARHYGIMIDGAKLNELFEEFKKK